MRSWLLLAVVSGLLASCAASEKRSADYSLYLVRHAEKQSAQSMSDENKDPMLTATGETRANNLASLLRDKNISEIWSSDYQRTRLTAAPTAAELGVTVEIYDPRDLEALASKLTQRQQNALVVGHSDTTPQLAALLCQCAVEEMPETEYDRLLVIKMHDGKASIKTLRQ